MLNNKRPREHPISKTPSHIMRALFSFSTWRQRCFLCSELVISPDRREKAGNCQQIKVSLS